MLGQPKSETTCRGGLRRGTTTTCPGRGPMAGFEVTLYGRFWGDRRGPDARFEKLVQGVIEKHPRGQPKATTISMPPRYMTFKQVFEEPVR